MGLCFGDFMSSCSLLLCHPGPQPACLRGSLDPEGADVQTNPSQDVLP